VEFLITFIRIERALCFILKIPALNDFQSKGKKIKKYLGVYYFDMELDSRFLE